MNPQHPPITCISSREFNQNTAGAKRAARRGPVFITDRGEPSHVLLTKEEYDRLQALENPLPPTGRQKLSEALADPRLEADFDWDPPKLDGFSLKVPDFE